MKSAPRLRLAADNCPMARPTPPQNFFADLSVLGGTPQAAGRTVQGLRRLIPILGGGAFGNGWKARVLAGGTDLIVQMREHPL